MAPTFEPLRPEHLPELAGVLLDSRVYEHIGGAVPTLAQFRADRERALAGPPPAAAGQHWINELVRDADGRMIGRLEATVHDGLAEVAFLFAPSHWGRGLATQALAWLHAHVERTTGCNRFWATTAPANQRCQALLRRSGYVPAPLPAVALLSHDAGDLVFRHRQSPP